MPAASASKRVKNTRVSRSFIIGNEAWTLDAKNHPGPIPDGHTKGWRVYVRPLPGGPDLTTWLKKVQFKLHHTYADASRTVEAPPFEVTETGYGEFEIELRLYFDSSSGEKAQYRFHRLRLEQFGEDSQVRVQKDTNLVTAETCEIVEFNEPSNDFWAKLTGEDQFGHLRKKTAGGKGRGKGKAAKVEWEGDREPGAGLPEKGTPDAPWSREMEKKVLEMLGDAHRELDVEIERERERAKDRQKRMQEVST
ncbi:yeats-domain-containing protein [Myriangium duriaei CBS 260.36]|uniref:Protein AF-9 homolog n=1 Tax=Myriangium duriaei CBS 260.36 TaxID=1168546 RepID=A0A9P4J6R5_9PEZI|nr:yeats-domain-containing protein [Myriangium duriaei CBS 260.36]